MRDDRCAEEKRTRVVPINENKNTWMQSNKRKQTKFKCVIKFAKIDLEWIGLETTRTIWH